MASFFSEFTSQIAATSLLEWVAVVLAYSNLYLAFLAGDFAISVCA